MHYLRVMTAMLAGAGSLTAGSSIGSHQDAHSLDDKASPAIQIIQFFTELGLSFVDLTDGIRRLVAAESDAMAFPSRCKQPPSPKDILQAFQKQSDAMMGQKDGPALEDPFDDVDQYAIFAAAERMALVDKALLSVLTRAGPVLKPIAVPLIPLLKIKIEAMEAFIKDAKVFAPKVQGLIATAENSVIAQVKATIDELTCVPFAVEL